MKDIKVFWSGETMLTYSSSNSTEPTLYLKPKLGKLTKHIRLTVNADGYLVFNTPSDDILITPCNQAFENINISHSFMHCEDVNHVIIWLSVKQLSTGKHCFSKLTLLVDMNTDIDLISGSIEGDVTSQYGKRRSAGEIYNEKMGLYREYIAMKSKDSDEIFKYFEGE